MAYAIDHPHRSHWWRRHPVDSAGDMQISVRPLRASGVALLTALVAAWGGISVFVGPEFGYRPTAVNAWMWSTSNWLLHLVPGAVGLAAGLMMLGLAAETVARRSRLMVAGLMALAAGAWFVLGPALWSTIEPGSPYGRAASAGDGFINALGANLGPGLLLAFLAGMAIKTAIAVPPGAHGADRSRPRPGRRRRRGAGRRAGSGDLRWQPRRRRGRAAHHSRAAHHNRDGRRGRGRSGAAGERRRRHRARPRTRPRASPLTPAAGIRQARSGR